MNRIVIGLLVAATAGAAAWWASLRGANPEAIAFAASEPHASPTPDATTDPTDKSIITPQREVDPKMVRIRPDVDPKMVVTPPWPPHPAPEPTAPSEL